MDEAPLPERSGRLPPQDLDAERSVLGAIMLDSSVLAEAIEILKPSDFYRPAHAKIYEGMQGLFEVGEPIDEITLAGALRSKGDIDFIGGAAYLNTLTERVPSAANLKYYAAIVRDRGLMRRLISTATSIVESGFDAKSDVAEVLDVAESRIFEIAEDRNKEALTPIKDVLKTTFAEIEKRFEQKQDITGVPSGFVDLDKMTAGFQPSELIIVAARPSMGKTAFALNIAQHAALQADKPVVVFSLEMSKEALVTRMICSHGKVDLGALRKGRLRNNDWSRLSNAIGDLSEAPIYIDDSGTLSVMEMRAKTRRLAAQGDGVSLVIVDYLQLMHSSSTEGREREISEISRGLKALAKELKVPVMALSQLNRSLESRTDKRPMLSDLRESGAIEQDADVI
ncbi:replicative DNA helicase, partial [Myxococcota bacterium]|nr:replicative DNA helicase [Myxococcota bacterium]